MLTLVEPAPAFILLADAKKHLNVTHNRDDSLIQGQIDSAIAFLDGPNGYLGCCIGEQRWAWKTAGFTSPFRLPLGPLQTVHSVTYKATDGTTKTVDAASYYDFRDAFGSMICPLGDWPTDVADRRDAVTVNFTAGFTAIPPQLKSAALLLVGHLYLNREQEVDTRTFPLGFGMYDLAHPYRVSL